MVVVVAAVAAVAAAARAATAGAFGEGGGGGRGPGPRRGLLPEVLTLPWGRYERRLHLFWRVRIPLYAGLAVAGWLAARGILASGASGAGDSADGGVGTGAIAGSAAGLAVGLAAAAAIDVRWSYVRPGPAAAAPTRVDGDDATARAARARADEAQRRWLEDAMPSPAGWTAPRGTLPAWNWLPPDGAQPRLDRMPRWVRAWYRTPLIDRYAHAWMWRHGGWDVLPPGANGSHAADGPR